MGFVRLFVLIGIVLAFTADGSLAAAGGDQISSAAPLAKPAAKVASRMGKPLLRGVADDPMLFPPLADGRAVAVALALHVINLSSIDEVAQQYTLSGYILASWVDRRLAWTPSGPDDNLRRYHPGDVWSPTLVVLNATSRPEFYDIAITARPDGMVNYSARLDVTLSANLNLRQFPFDAQALEVVIHPLRVNAGQVVFVKSADSTWMTNEFSSYSPLASWRMLGMASRLNLVRILHGAEISEMRFSIRLRRRWEFYLWKLCLPLFLMVCLSWAVFWVDSRDLANQVQIAVTTILTIIAFGLALSFTLPRVPYLTFLDAFFLTSYVFVFLAMLELMVVHVAHRSRRERRAMRIRRVSRWAVPLAYLAIIAMFAVGFGL